jgi:hypothetical protein
MAFLEPHFDNDIFVSYSQGDPSGTGKSPLKDWTDTLVKKLIGDIQSIDPAFDELRFWMDAQIDPTAPLTQELRDKVKTSGILMVIMSPRYLKSKWCKDELEWFRDQIRERSNDQGRVFVVRVLPTEKAEWPDFLRDENGNSLIGFLFYDTTTMMPFGWHDVRGEDYVKQLWTLQTALTKRLREIRERHARRQAPPAAPAVAPVPQTAAAVATLFAAPQAQAAPQAPPVQAPPVQQAHGIGRIYLQAKADQIAARNDVQRALAPLGIVGLSIEANQGGTLNAWNEEAKARFEIAKNCHALVLLRTDTSPTFLGDLLQIGVDEREQIRSARNSALPCAVLDLSGKPLPIDVSTFGINRFDLSRQDWPDEFAAWLQEARRPGTGGS